MTDLDNIWLVKHIFHLSDRALIRMVNRLFKTEYGDNEDVTKEWTEHRPIGVCLTIGCANRYEFQTREDGGCIQIYAEDRGCLFHYEDALSHSVVQIREPQMICFGRNRKQEYYTTLEFPGNERITLPIHVITLADYSAWQLMEAGLMPFLPYLFCCFMADKGNARYAQDALEHFIIYDIAGALNESMKLGDLTVFDAQRLKQLCRKTLWRFMPREEWMQNLGFQELVLDMLETDIDLLEHRYEMELSRLGNKYA